MKSFMRGAAALGAAAALALGASACGSAKQAGGSDSGGGKGGSDSKASGGFKIGLLLPEAKTARYEKFDRPYITKKIKSLCPKCQVIYQNANSEANKQQQQADSALTQGAKVLIVDAVDYKSIAGSVTKAHSQGVPVVAYDRLAQGPVSAYSSFDNVKVGKFQGQALLKAMKKHGDTKKQQIMMLNGAPTDPNAGQFKQGAHQALDGHVKIAKEYDVDLWDPQTAGKQVTDGLTPALKKDLGGLYSANDPMAGAGIASLKQAGIDPVPPVTGQDSEITGIQRVLSGDQSMDIYKPIKAEAEIAAAEAVALGQGKKVDSSIVGSSGGTYTTSDNGTEKKIPSVLFTPVVVTKDNIKSTVIKDGFWTAKDICTGRYKKLCAAHGIK